MLKIEIDTKTRAFRERGTAEQLEWIFRNVVRRVRDGEENFEIEDIHGEKCGCCIKTGDEDEN